MVGNIMFELYRLDDPTDVVYTVRSTSLRVAMLDGDIAAREAGDVYLYSQDSLTAVTSRGVLGVRRKVYERKVAVA